MTNATIKWGSIVWDGIMNLMFQQHIEPTCNRDIGFIRSFHTKIFPNVLRNYIVSSDKYNHQPLKSGCFY